MGNKFKIAFKVLTFNSTELFQEIKCWLDLAWRVGCAFSTIPCVVCSLGEISFPWYSEFSSEGRAALTPCQISQVTLTRSKSRIINFINSILPYSELEIIYYSLTTFSDNYHRMHCLHFAKQLFSSIANSGAKCHCSCNLYVKYFETKTKHLLCSIKGKGVHLFSYSSQTRSDIPLFGLLDSLMIGNILFGKVWKIYRVDFFQGNDLNFSQPAPIWPCSSVGRATVMLYLIFSTLEKTTMQATTNCKPSF